MKVICTVQHEKKKAENKLNMACSLDCDKEEVEHGLYTVQVLTDTEIHWQSKSICHFSHRVSTECG